MTVVLQWEPFSARIGANGVSYLVVRQSICSLPPYPVQCPIRIEYGGVGKITYIEIDPSSSEQIKIYLDVSGTATSSTVKVDDQIKVFGGIATWIALG